MANVLIQDIEVDGEKVLAFLTSAEQKIAKAGPQAVAGLATLLGAAASAISSVGAAAAAEGVNFTLDATAWTNLKAVWPDIVAFAADLGIKL